MNVLVMPKKNRKEDMRALVAEIKKYYRLFEKSNRKMLHRAIKMGILLRRGKRQVGHANFTAWIASSFPFKLRTAELYMQVARSQKELKAKCISGFTEAIEFCRQSNNRKDKSGKNDKDPDLQKDLTTLNKSLVTPRRIIQRVEKKQGWAFWRKENNKMLKQVEENAVALIILLTKRFSSKSRGKSK